MEGLFNTDERALHIRNSRKIDILDEITQLSTFYQTSVLSQEELSQNKKEKKSFFLSLMKAKQNKQKQTKYSFRDTLITQYFKQCKNQHIGFSINNYYQDQELCNSRESSDQNFDSNLLSIDASESTFDGSNTSSNSNVQYIKLINKRERKADSKRQKAIQKINITTFQLFGADESSAPISFHHNLVDSD